MGVSKGQWSFLLRLKGLRMVARALWRSKTSRVVSWSEILHEPWASAGKLPRHNTKNLTVSVREWDWNCFEIHRLVLEHNSISSSIRAKPWMFDSVYIKVNQMKLYGVHFIAAFLNKYNDLQCYLKMSVLITKYGSLEWIIIVQYTVYNACWRNNAMLTMLRYINYTHWVWMNELYKTFGLCKGHIVCHIYDGLCFVVFYQWFSARLLYLQCVSNGETTVLH